MIEEDLAMFPDGPTRPAKRRKIYRKRAEYEGNIEGGESKSSTNDEVPPDALSPHSSLKGMLVIKSDDEIQSHLSMTEIIARRKVARKNRGGIEFSNNSMAIPETASPDRAAVPEDIASAQIEAVVDRFAPQTGQVADVDNHMMAYIDSELAKRHQKNNDAATYVTSSSMPFTLSSSGAIIDMLGQNRQPAALGQLHEIDLGPDATLKNIARTEAAKRRLEGEKHEEEDGRKLRLGRDGKPRRRKRRNSDDVKRDHLVEQVLQESRLEIYDEPEAEIGNGDQAADDRIAEQFRRDFIDAISSRRQRRPAAATKPKPGEKVDTHPRGPKLGGSRSARAAMRELQEKTAKK